MSESASQSQPPERSSRSARLGSLRKWPLAIVVMGSALAIGSVHSVSLIVVAVALAVAAGLTWKSDGVPRPRRPATIVLLVGVGLLIFTALTLIPLPIGVLRAIAPANAEIWSRALAPLHEAGPAYAPISLDPIATKVQLLRGIVYVVAFLLALRVANHRSGVVFLECALVATGVVLGVAAFLHPAFGVDKVFGFYRHNPAISPRHVAPLLNANHLAAYLNIAFCISLAMALAPRPEVPRVVPIAAAAVLVATQMWVASRGGVVAMALGAVLVIAMGKARSGRLQKVVVWLGLAAVVASGIAMTVLASTDEAWRELANTDVSKVQLAKDALRMAPSFPVFGTGRGAFQPVFPAFRTIPGYFDFTHPESIVPQWIVEWGIPVAVIAAVLLAVALRPGVALARSRPTIGPWAAIVVVVAHNLVDFSMEVPAVMIALATCAAVCVGGSAERAQRHAIDAWASKPRWTVAFACAALMVGAALVIPGLGREIDDERDAFHTRALDPAMSKQEFHDAVRGGMLRHPAEPYLPFSGAIRASRARDESVLPWVARTFERANVYGPAHLILARSLVLASPAQARMEYRFAAEQFTGAAELSASESLRLVGGYDDALEVVAEGPMAVPMLEIISNGVANRLPATRIRIDEELLRRRPGAVEPLKRAMNDAIADLSAGESAPWCVADRDGCLAAGAALASRLREAEPNRCEPFSLQAKLLIAGKDVKAALDVLQQASEKVNDRDVCLTLLAETAVSVRDDVRANVALDKLEHVGCAQQDACITNWQKIAAIEEGRGNIRRALGLYRKVLERAPDDVGTLTHIASLASRSGMHAEAAEAYRKLLMKDPKNPHYEAALASEKGALFEGALKR